METLQLRKAERRKAKLRVGVTAPSGAGKTYSSLLIARGLASDWGKIAMIDTENGSGDLYANKGEMGEYNIITLEAPFSPERYIEAIQACQVAGMEVVIIDSATHEWDGKGGCLEIQEQLGGRYQDWAKVTPRHRKFLDTILQSNCHIITTTRRKQDYDMTKDSNGRVRVEKVGLKEVQREGFEYELTLNLEIGSNHLAKASKDRTGLFADKPEFIITLETGKLLKEWSESGRSSDAEINMEKRSELRIELGKILKAMGGTEEWVIGKFGPLTSMPLKKMESIISQLKEMKKKKADEKKAAGQKAAAPVVEGVAKEAEIVDEKK